MAFTTWFIDSFEHGRTAAAGALGVWDISTGPPTIDTTQHRTGTRSLKVLASAVANRAGYTFPASTRYCSVSFYVLFTGSFPGANCQVASFTNASANGQVRWNSATGKLVASINNVNNADVGPALSLDTWYLVDVIFDTRTGTSTINVRVNEGTTVQVTRALAAADIASMSLGTQTTETITAYYDDLAISVTADDAMLGHHQVENLIPTSDGTHNINASGDYDSFTTTAFSNATTTGAAFLGHRPLQAANTANQVIRNDAGLSTPTTRYMEFLFENMAAAATAPILAVRSYAVYVESSTTGASLGEARLCLSDGTEVLTTGSLSVIDSTEDPGTTVTLKKRMCIDPSGGWDGTKVNGLLARVGFSDFTPNVNFIDFMIDVLVQGTNIATPSAVAGVGGVPAVTAQGAAVVAPSVVAGVGAMPVPTSLPTGFVMGTAGAGTPTINVGMPSGWAKDDIFLLFVQTDNRTVPTPSGWTAGPVLVTADNTVQLAIFWKRATSSESDFFLTVTSANHLLGIVMGVRGCRTTGTPWDVLTSGVEDTSDTSLSIPGGTTSSDNNLVVLIEAFIGAGSSNASWTNADLANIGIGISGGTITLEGTGGTLQWTVGEKATAGAYTATTFTNSVATKKAFASIAMVPAPNLAQGAAVAKPSVVSGVGAVPAVTAVGTSGGANGSATPSVVAGIGLVPAVTAQGAAIAAPAAVVGIGAQPAITGKGNALTTPSVVAGIGAQPAVTAQGAAIALPPVVAGIGAIPAVTAQGAGVGTPSVVAGIGLQPAVTAKGLAVATPSVVAGVGAQPAVTAQGGGVGAPSVVAGIGAVPSIIGIGTAKATPSVVAGIGLVPALIAQGGAIASPAVVAGIGAQPPVTLTGTGLATPAAVVVIGAQPSVTAQGAAIASPSVVVGIGVQPAVTAKAGAIALPAMVAGIGAQPPAIGIGTAVATPSVVTGIGAVPNVTASGAQSGTATPPVVTGVGAVPAVTVIGTAVAKPSTVAGVGLVLAVTVRGAAIASPATTVGIGSIPTPLASAGALATPTTVTGAANMPGITGRGGAVVGPTTVAGVGQVPTPAAMGSGLVTPATVAGVGNVGAVTAQGSAIASPQSVAGVSSIPPVLLTGSGVATPQTVLALALISQVMAQGGATASLVTVAGIASIPNVIASGSIGVPFIELLITLADIATHPINLRERSTPITLVETVMRYMNLRDTSDESGITDSDRSRVIMGDG